MDYRIIRATPVTPHIGAVIEGIDLTRPIPPAAVEELRDALMTHQAVFFRGQELSHQNQMALCRLFGELHISSGGDGTNSKPLAEVPEVRRLHFDADSKSVSGNETWHTDQSCNELPPMGTCLYIHTVPPDGGGDTLFASMYAAYDALSQPMKRYLAGMTAIHDGAGGFARTANNDLPVNEHPVIARHPVTGRTLLYVNPMFTDRLVGVSKEESAAVLSYLYQHCAKPDFHVRFHWQPHSVALWDNRCTHHLALWDYYPHTRSGFRIQIKGTDKVIPA